MKVTGIIAEYNPFHNGHAYQIRELRKQTGADYIMIAMSGDFVQRGAPAIMDKYIRTKMALENGADLVLELPTLWATASAERFAMGGVSLLQNTKVVDYLGFGAETKDLSLLRKMAAILTEEPDTYRKILQENLKKGKSFPAARSRALSGCLPDAGIPELFAQPNNILALEYLKALECLRHSCQGKNQKEPDTTPTYGQSQPSIMEPVLIVRAGDGYHDPNITSNFASATAIRHLLLSKDKTISQSEQELNGLSESLPSSCLEAIAKYQKQSCLLSEDDLSQALGCRLLLLRHRGYTEFADCSLELSRRIQNLLDNYRGFSQFCQLLKTKELTYSRISRTLLHILMDIKTDDTNTFSAYSGYALGSKKNVRSKTETISSVPYLRILGFRKKAAPLLSAIKQNASVPLISKMADAASILSAESYAVLEKDILASDLYMQLIRSKCGCPAKNEMNHGLVLLP